MKDYMISCCSTVDLTQEKVDALGLPVLNYTYILNGKNMKDDFGKTLSMKDFYQAMRDGADTATSANSVGAYEEFFRSLLAGGKDLLHVAMSSGISGSYQAACIAAEAVREEFPGQTLLVADSLAIASGYGLFMEEILEKKKEGLGIEELFFWIENNRKSVQHLFFSTDLTFYVKGGRVSKVSGVIGGIFDICPLLHVDGMGKLVPIERVRTKRKVRERIVERMEELARDRNAYTGRVLISHSDCMEDARIVQELVYKRFPGVKEIDIYDIGTTIGCHSGPGTVALFFLGDERKESL